MTASTLERFDEIAATHVADDADPGVVALVAHGDDVHVVTRGALSIGGAPLRRDSLFRISSVTKPITGAATLALVEEGLFTLDEPVDRLLPELAGRRVLRRWDGPLDDTVPASRPITVRDLLTFTLGFGMDVAMFMSPEPWPVVAAAAELHLATLGPPQPLEQPDPDTWSARFGTLPLMAQPGERWFYNTGALVLGVLLARAARMSFAEVLRTRIFEPLGMRDTAFLGLLPNGVQPFALCRMLLWSEGFSRRQRCGADAAKGNRRRAPAEATTALRSRSAPPARAWPRASG